MAWNTSLVSIGSPVLFFPPHGYDPLRLLTGGTAIAIIISIGLFCLPFLPLAQCNCKHQVFLALERALKNTQPSSEKCSYLEELSCKENSVKDNWVCFNQNQDTAT